MPAVSSNQSPRSPVLSRSAEDESWKNRLQRWFIGISGMGYGLSLLLHLIVLIVMSIVILEQSGQGPIGTILAISEEEEGELEQLLDTRLEPNDNQQSFVSLPRLEAAVLNAPEISVKAGGKSGKKGKGFQFAMPGNGRAVVKGSFTAWTVPEDPRPGQAYKIVIQIRLPKHVKAYQLSDLSGLVEGTDSYRQSIPDTIRGSLPVRENQAQLVVDVPGAEELVKDTIYVRSRILDEKQELEIEF